MIVSIEGHRHGKSRKEKNRRLYHKFDGKCFNCAGRKVTALSTAGAQIKRVKNPELPTTGRRAVAAVGATSAEVRSTGRETVRSAELKRAQCWQN